MIIYLESTINLLVSEGQKETVEKLIQQGEVKEVNGIKYLKIND